MATIVDSRIHIFALFVVFVSLCWCSEEPSNTIHYEITSDSDSTPEEYLDEVVKNEETAKIVRILEHLPVLKKGMLKIVPEVEHFIMTNASLTEITPGAFDNQNIVQEINLRDNKLSIIQPETFKHLKIAVLDLSLNRISAIENNAVYDLPNLRELLLSGNLIARLGGRSIVGTPLLHHFYISYNKLKILENKMFDFLSEALPVTFIADHNEIEAIHPNAFKRVNLKNLILDHNLLQTVHGQIFHKNRLELLNLTDNRVGSLPNHFFKQKHRTLVDLRNNPLGCEFAGKLDHFSKKTGSEVWYDGC